ncbi:sirohydrochlorin chelatase [Fodinibius saliphilus]|uniref:sirohydrochlorin chelatase n=1 Tax=Fodinibius saliphilus TaxID=1920650 RepID=UPI0014872ACA|nr:CbiX/SirB N-terminal domain-containing protein [Fodinibius saliphilus]
MSTIVSSVTAQDTGVLILAHGGSDQWNDAVVEAAQPLKKDYSVEVAFGMANAVTMHNSIEELEKKGINKIITIPLFISSHSPIIRQTEYLLGLRDTLADDPMPLMHHKDEYLAMVGKENTDSSQLVHGMLIPENLQPLEIDAKVTMTPALDDHDLVAQILHDRIIKLSEEPSNETVVIAGHGPNRGKDNIKWVENMESLTRKVQDFQKNKGEGFKQIFALTVRDDANEQIHEQAKQQFRNVVRQTGHFGDVIVVPLFLSSGGREHAVAKRLEGLEFKWSGEALLPHPLVSDFLVTSVTQAIKNNDTGETAK